MHNGIKLEIRETRIAVKEFNTNELIRRLLKLFDEKTVPNVDILNAIYHLNPQDARSELDIKEKIQRIFVSVEIASIITSLVFFIWSIRLMLFVISRLKDKE